MDRYRWSRLAYCSTVWRGNPGDAYCRRTALGEDEQQNLPSYFGFARDSHGTFLNGSR